MNALSYRVILEPDEDDGGFNVVIPAFPTAHTQGDDVEEALRNAREVIELELSVQDRQPQGGPVGDDRLCGRDPRRMRLSDGFFSQVTCG